jgi:hypothetical protein
MIGGGLRSGLEGEASFESSELPADLKICVACEHLVRAAGEAAGGGANRGDGRAGRAERRVHGANSQAGMLRARDGVSMVMG